MKKSGFKSLAALGRTLYQWKDEIARMWRFRKSNGITEGFHRKIKLIQRRAYGFRNFENYRIRVRVLCAVKVPPQMGKSHENEVLKIWWPELESNQRHKDFQSFALPTELSGQDRCY